MEKAMFEITSDHQLLTLALIKFLNPSYIILDARLPCEGTEGWVDAASRPP